MIEKYGDIIGIFLIVLGQTIMIISLIILGINLS
jgi:hypothetical protein